MCGIVGFTTPGQDPAAAKQIVQGMADLIRHRGPDGEGCYADGTAALGHRRLSVIDLAGGGQPMLNEDGTLVVVFNGEIYNYKTLRARLQQRGHTFATDSDTEVLLHGYEEWGRDLPCRLRGMFAFAVWDRKRGTLFCARDLFGIKPLCYYKKGETLLFASEIKAFLAHPAFEKRLNEARLPDWLSMEYLPDAETLFTGVYELPPAHTLTWQAGRVTLARYAALRFRAKRGRSLRAWAREIGDAVAESADAHRIADVEVGCFLSGGVDSSLITCEMARRQPAVQCFSVGYAEEAYSELPAARAAAQALGVPLTETTVTADDFLRRTAPFSGIWTSRCPTRRRCRCISCARRRGSGSRSCSRARARMSCSAAIRCTGRPSGPNAGRKCPGPCGGRWRPCCPAAACCAGAHCRAGSGPPGPTMPLKQRRSAINI